ncbi:MAG: ATP synthase F1 subunit epsilon [Candidatus Xenobia bacterium]
MAKSFQVEIVTPESLRYEEQATYIEVRGSEGDMGILADHAPLVALLSPGVTRVRTPQGRELVFATGEGFARIANNKASVLVEFAQAPDEINADQVRQARDAAMQALQGNLTPHERTLRSTDLAAANARLRVLESRS